MYSTDGRFIEDTYIYGVGEVPCEKVISSSGTSDIESIKVGSSIHKEIRNFIRPHLKPGLKLSELADLIENKCVQLTDGNGINSGIGFPSSLSVNDCAAHFTPSSKYDVTLDKNSILKIDFGVEVNGWITDSAFTIAFNDTYKNLLDGVKEATETGIKNAAVDVNIKEWSKDIQEVMESHEVTIDGKTDHLHVIKNLGGHNILKNQIHGGIFLPGAPISHYPDNLKFQKGVYAIETFGSTKSDTVFEKTKENSLYMNQARTTYKVPKNKTKFYNNLLKNFNTIPYCDRYLDKLYHYDVYKPKMEKLADLKIVKKYPPLHCKEGGMTAQYEHTIHLDEGKKIIFSKSTDY
jgi:methionyl aminopeptidase